MSEETGSWAESVISRLRSNARDIAQIRAMIDLARGLVASGAANREERRQTSRALPGNEKRLEQMRRINETFRGKVRKAGHRFVTAGHVSREEFAEVERVLAETEG